MRVVAGIAALLAAAMLSGSTASAARGAENAVLQRQLGQAPTKLEAELLSRGGKWTFGRVKGPVLCAVTFTYTTAPYGAHVLKACHPNESFWKLNRAGVLLILDAGGKATSKLSRVNANRWQGPYLGTASIPAAGIVHYIRR